jgi:hypothetical protein
VERNDEEHRQAAEPFDVGAKRQAGVWLRLVREILMATVVSAS